MEATQELIAWHQLRSIYIEPGIPLEHSLLDKPKLSLVYDPSPSSLGVRLQVSEPRPWKGFRPLRNVVVRNVVLSGIPYIEVLTTAPALFRPIYALISDVLARLADGESDCLRALELSLDDFDSLLSCLAELTKDAVIGLYGELWVLLAILAEDAANFSCWVGFDRQLHDFRLGELELEVKTTTANMRRHVIHGLNQLTPSPGHRLSLVSLRLGVAGMSDGESLNMLVARVREAIASDTGHTDQFNRALAAIGYGPDQVECEVRYVLVAPALSVAIGTEYPELSHAWLAQVLGDSPATRVRNVELTLDLEGLGTPFDVHKLSKGKQ